MRTSKKQLQIFAAGCETAEEYSNVIQERAQSAGREIPLYERSPLQKDWD